MTRRTRVTERGSATVELAILAPGIVLIGLLILAGGRTGLAHTSIDQVAETAARDASLARTAEQARQNATVSANQSLADNHLNCQRTTITVDTRGFSVPVGQPAQVTVHVTCEVALGDLAIPGLPGTTTLRADFTSPLDPNRGRSG